MTKQCRDYFWKDGIPCGVRPTEDLRGIACKIPMDPYRKRISLEKHKEGHFDSVIYDSALLNFRHLTVEEQTAWHEIALQELPEKATIRMTG